jgi:hypothetical protein
MLSEVGVSLATVTGQTFFFYRYTRVSNIEAASNPGRLHCVPYTS